MTNELKPCPFCPDGGKPDVSKWEERGWGGEYNFTAQVVCLDCLSHGPVMAGVSKVTAVASARAAWNHRAERTCKPKHWNNASGVAFARGECSECGGYLLENSETGKPRPYCPHCGAKVVEQ